MTIDLMNALYTASMIVLAFVTAIIVTKIISRYLKKDEEEELEQ